MTRETCLVIGEFDRNTRKAVSKDLKRSGFAKVRASSEAVVNEGPIELQSHETVALHEDVFFNGQLDKFVERTDTDKVLIVAWVAGALIGSNFSILTLDEFKDDL